VRLRLDGIRHGLRLFHRQPGLTGLAVTALSLGIGLTTTMFSILDALVLRGLPFENADRLLHLEMQRPATAQYSLEVPVHDFVDWRARQRSFEDLAAFRSRDMVLSGSDGRAERFLGSSISASAFRLIGVTAALGRTFSEAEDRPSGPPVVLLGHALWRDRFGADPNVIGRSVRVNGEALTVIGVMPEGFRFPVRDSVWVPLRPDPTAHERGAGPTLEVFGLLKPDVGLEQARAEMAAIARSLETEHPQANGGQGSVVKPYAAEYVGENGVKMLWVMMAAVFGVVLVACANVANLLLGRAAERSRELGIRSALGAGRGRLITHLLGEAVVLAAAGGALGLVFARLGVAWFNSTIPIEDAPFWFEVRIALPSAVFVLALVALSALLSGIAPALQASRADVSDVLREDTRTGTGLRMGRLSRGLVVAQVATACGLLVAAGLMIRTIANMGPGHMVFESRNVLTARLQLREETYADESRRAAFHAELEDRLAALPGARSVAVMTSPPGIGGGRDQVAIEGEPVVDERLRPLVTWSSVSPRFFGTFGVGVHEGRAFTAADGLRAPKVAIVNRAFVRRFFPDGRALGRRVRPVSPGMAPEWLEVVGTVPDLDITTPQRPQGEAVYVPLAQSPSHSVFVALATAGPPESLAASLRDAVAQLDPDLPARGVKPFAALIHEFTWGMSVIGRLFTAFGAAALFLAAVGVYGVMAFAVSRRTREIGIRMALGATRGRVLLMVLGQGARQLALGALIGMVLALALGRLMVVALVGVSPSDPVTFGAVLGALALAGLGACLWPARRAASMDPAGALRCD
jgi:putative ABC transport system permease protein